MEALLFSAPWRGASSSDLTRSFHRMSWFTAVSADDPAYHLPPTGGVPQNVIPAEARGYSSGVYFARERWVRCKWILTVIHCFDSVTAVRLFSVFCLFVT